MPNKSSAAKRHRQSEKARDRNRTVRSKIQTERRRFLEAVERNDGAAARASFDAVAKLVDSAVVKGVYHRNTADRKKSRLHKRFNALSENNSE